MDSKYFIAFDLGATSGRTILGTLTGDRLIEKMMFFLVELY